MGCVGALLFVMCGCVSVGWMWVRGCLYVGLRVGVFMGDGGCGWMTVWGLVVSRVLGC